MYTYPVVCVNTAEEPFYKTRSTNRGIPTLLCVLILQSSYSTRSTSRRISTLLCGNTEEELFYKTRSNSGEYMYPVVCVSTAKELFYKTRSTSTGIPTLLCVLILQRSSSTRQGAQVEGYLPFCVC